LVCRRLIGPTKYVHQQHGRGAGTTNPSKLLFCRTNIKKIPVRGLNFEWRTRDESRCQREVGEHRTPPNSHKYHHFNLGESTQTRYNIAQPTCPKTLLFRIIQSTKHCANGVDNATAATAAQTQDPEAFTHEFERHKLNSQILCNTHTNMPRTGNGGVASGVVPNVALTGPNHEKHLFWTPNHRNDPHTSSSDRIRPRTQTDGGPRLPLRLRKVGLDSGVASKQLSCV
jgi:hypothetical protein